MVIKPNTTADANVGALSSTKKTYTTYIAAYVMPIK